MRIRIFNDPARYEELLQLLNSPGPNRPSYLAIARHFHCDHTTIIYQARKIGIPVGGRHTFHFILPKVQIPKVFIDPRHPILQQEKVNDGKSCYADYVRAERRRKERSIESFFV